MKSQGNLIKTEEVTLHRICPPLKRKTNQIKQDACELLTVRHS